MTDYLSLAEILAIHADQIERYGGVHGVRDRTALNELVGQFQSGYSVDPIREAAKLWRGLAQNEPFVDGNKRTAIAATYTFLAINGMHLTADAEDAYRFIDGLHEGGWFRFGNLEPWLRLNSESSPAALDVGSSPES